LKEAGFEVKLFDTTFYKWTERSATENRIEYLQIRPYSSDKYDLEFKSTDMLEDFRKVVEEFDPLLIGASVVEPTYRLGLKLLNHVSDLKIPTIMGGVHVIFAPEMVINEDCVDMICIGEGEKSFVDLCKKIAAGEDHTAIPNIWVKKDGNIIKNPNGPLIDINKLPYLDFSIYEKERLYRPMTGKIYKTVIVEVSRGCPYMCSYCGDHALAMNFKEQGKWYREKDIERVIDEIKYYVEKYDAEYLYIMSESFLAMRTERFDKFVELYKDIKLPFWFNTRPENITREKVKKLEEINCHRISLGIEHGNEEFRRGTLHRYVSNERIIEACKILEESSITYSVNNIIGFPGETRELIFDTINLNKQIVADGISTHIFTPYHGTELRELSEQKGYIEKDLIAEDFFIGSVMNMPQLPNEEIIGLMRTIPLYIKFPKSDWDKIELAEKFDEEGNKVFEELKEIYWEE
jgi:radical SAM superfamily enzyme YgiQ (UPF0313 family)